MTLALGNSENENAGLHMTANLAHSNRVLVLFAHPAIQKSRVNRQMARGLRGMPGVTFRDLYEAYPDLDIHVEEEQQLLAEHDVIVFQHPFYWYSTPAILKEWFDLVLEHGFAYGEGGDRLQGKAWMHALTAGGPKDAYGEGGYNRFTVEQLMAPLEQTAHLCGMHFLSPFRVHSTLSLDPATEIPAIAKKYSETIQKLRDHQGPWSEWQAPFK